MEIDRAVQPAPDGNRPRSPLSTSPASPAGGRPRGGIIRNQNACDACRARKVRVSRTRYHTRASHDDIPRWCRTCLLNPSGHFFILFCFWRGKDGERGSEPRLELTLIGSVCTEPGKAGVRAAHSSTYSANMTGRGGGEALRISSVQARSCIAACYPSRQFTLT